MNLYSEFQKLFPAQRKYYGKIISITGDSLAVEIIGGGLIFVTNLEYATTFNVNDSVWMEKNDLQWILTSAPAFTATEILI